MIQERMYGKNAYMERIYWKEMEEVQELALLHKFKQMNI